MSDYESYESQIKNLDEHNPGVREIRFWLQHQSGDGHLDAYLYMFEAQWPRFLKSVQESFRLTKEG